MTGKANMRHLLSAACGFILVCAPAARAEDVVVVELFTSQGCVSCPPADEFFAMLTGDPRVIPLSLHVDYWDYIGWEDTFAQPASPVALTVERQGDQLVIRAEADPPLHQPVQVQLVRYRPEETVEIERGENAGKTVTYRNVVTDWQVLTDWTGQSPLALDAPVAGDDQAVVILQDPGPSAILAAARPD